MTKGAYKEKLEEKYKDLSPRDLQSGTQGELNNLMTMVMSLPFLNQFLKQLKLLEQTLKASVIAVMEFKNMQVVLFGST